MPYSPVLSPKSSLSAVRFPWPVVRGPYSVVLMPCPSPGLLANSQPTYECVCLCARLTIIQKFYKQNERPLHGERAGRVRARARTETETTCKQFSSAIPPFFPFVLLLARVCVWVEHSPVPLTAGSVWISVAWPQEMPPSPPTPTPPQRQAQQQQLGRRHDNKSLVHCRKSIVLCQ